MYNNGAQIGDAISSVSGQSYTDVEYIIIDGGSTDNTLSEIELHSDCITKVVSEPDQGIYDAMNKNWMFQLVILLESKFRRPFLRRQSFK